MLPPYSSTPNRFGFFQTKPYAALKATAMSQRPATAPLTLAILKQALPSEEKDEWYRAESPATGDWNNIGDDVNAKYFTHPSVKSQTGPPSEQTGPFPEFEFCFLPTKQNKEALLFADGVIKQSIWDYCRKNHLAKCHNLWDDVCDITLDIHPMRLIFLPQGWAGQHMPPSRAVLFDKALDNLYQFRNLLAHPGNSSENGATLEVVCQKISHVRTMAKLLEDWPAVSKIDDLLERLFVEGRQVMAYVEQYRTLAGLPQGMQDWPRHCERLLNRVVSAQVAYVENPSSEDEWQCHYRGKRIPPLIGAAAEDWAAKYDFVGVLKPDYAVGK